MLYKGQVTFRIIEDNDKDFLRQVFADSRAWELEYTNWTTADYKDFLDRQFDLQTTSYQMSYIGAVHRIIQLDGIDIGRLIILRRDDCLRIIDISILSTYQGRGIGTDLLKTLINEAAGGKVPVRLMVERGNPAMRLYSRLGFKAEAEQGNHIALIWEPDLSPREI